MLRPESIPGRCFAAVPTPFGASGDLHLEGLRHLVSSITARPIGGVVVGEFPGRGSLSSADRMGPVLDAWREGLGSSRSLIVSAGASTTARRPEEVFESAWAMAELAADRGADALLVRPPGAFRDRPDRDRLILEYHSRVAEAGSPLLISYRREASGGIAYAPEVLAQLLARPEVLGVEIATFDGIAIFQQVEALVRELAPGKVVVTGEERFLGYSLMSGADALMVGLASAFPEAVLGLLEAHLAGEAARFLELSARVDRLARLVFSATSESSAIRLTWALVHLGVLPIEAAHDPSGRPPNPVEFDRLGEALAKLGYPTEHPGGSES